MKEKKGDQNCIKKISEKELNMVGGGFQKIKDISGFFSRNTLSTVCDNCGEPCKIKLKRRNISKRDHCDPGFGKISVRHAEVKWVCKKCNSTNLTRAEKSWWLMPFLNKWDGGTEIV